MKNPLAILKEKKNVQKAQDLKLRVLKNREGVLDAFAETIKGARACPLMMGQKCIGSLCELFQEYNNIDNKGKKVTYSRCDFNQMPLLMIENANLLRTMINEQRATQKLLIALHEAKGGNVNVNNEGK